MVENGQVTVIRQMTYGGAPSDVETLTFDRLRAINDGGTQRADFHVVAVALAGSGVVSVDFVRRDVCGGAAVWIRPGAVHRWSDFDTLVGDLVLFKAEAPITSATRALAAAHHREPVWSVPDADRPLLRAAVEHLRLETSGAVRTPLPEAPNLLLSLLLGRLDPGPVTQSRQDPLLAAFQDLVEANYRRHHDVAFYATQLGYSARTLTRAVQRGTGASAKAYIAARVVLEAKRLLAHDRLSSARCAAHLGFSDPSNFSLFFRTKVGQLPGQWQQSAAPI